MHLACIFLFLVLFHCLLLWSIYQCPNYSTHFALSYDFYKCLSFSSHREFVIKSLPIHIQWRKQESRHRENHAAKLHSCLAGACCLSFRRVVQFRPQAGSKRAGGWYGLLRKPWISSNTLKKPRHFPIICETLTHWAKIHTSTGKWEQQHSTGWKHILFLDSIPVYIIKRDL